MTDLTPSDVRRWDAEAVLKVFQVANARGQTLYRFGEDLGQTGQLLAEWEGEAGSAFHSSLGALRSDIDKDSHESTQVSAAVSTASADVQACKAMMSQVDEAAEALDFTITEDWKVQVGDSAALLMGAEEAELQRQILQSDLDAVKVKAHTTDHELAAAMRTAVGAGLGLGALLGDAALVQGRAHRDRRSPSWRVAGQQVVWVPSRLTVAHRNLHAAAGAKSDVIDAIAVAHAVIATPDLARHHHIDERIRELRALADYRTDVVKRRTMVINQIKAQRPSVAGLHPRRSDSHHGHLSSEHEAEHRIGELPRRAPAHRDDC